MATERTAKVVAASAKYGMTLDEMTAFVREAMRAEIPGDTIVRQVSTWRSTITELKANG
ncbi:hypothetical protein J4573_16260 [Actinomadura barringtoniae]|uniref:Uncharacterized protein n=1 Tax=Actinomadura barringtoniae TaxID=1427535 RepID=A0A939T207_9ACTN|nr:hypothetical protein [Actinomadura barringtoniae]MBO2448656.1 hypothetical protein [Actinomadura barringtoniae]